MKPASTLSEVEYPSGDGQPMAESGIHAVLFAILLSMLRNYFHARAGVHVTGNIFLYYQQGDTEKKRSPDLMVIKGLADSQRERDSFKIWEEGVVPCVVIELTSRSTAEEDTGPKKKLYQQLGVREYFLFDPRGEYLPRQLMGYRLVPLAQNNGDNGLEVVQQYDELTPAADGSLPSVELGLRLVPCGQQLDLVNQLTGERLLPPRDLAEKADKAEKALTEERRLRVTLQAEIARLRAALPPEPPASPPDCTPRTSRRNLLARLPPPPIDLVPIVPNVNLGT